MNFFEPPPKAPDSGQRPPPPPWMGPGDELGVSVPANLVLARTGELVVMVGEITAYSNGFEMRLRVLMRLDDQIGPMLFHRPPRPGEPLPDDMFRFGIEYADGRRATTTAMGGPSSEARAHFEAVRDGRTPTVPKGPLLMQRGGGGGGRSYDLRFWAWPLPPPGVLKLACEWPQHGIPLTFAEIDGDRLREAGANSEILWPDTGPADGGWTRTTAGS